MPRTNFKLKTKEILMDPEVENAIAEYINDEIIGIIE